MMQGVSNMPPNTSGQQVNLALSFGQSSLSMPTNHANNLLIGLIQLRAHCSTVYHNVTDPLCSRTDKSLILGEGTDPLDYIYIYMNEEDPELRTPRHWHYVGFGLSDIYNYAMLCESDRLTREKDPSYNATTPALPEHYPKPGSIMPKISGFGFELTFRLKCDDNSDNSIDQPPMWPCHIMQDLARYVFQSKNLFKVGDHVAWRSALDGEGVSNIEHMLMTLDPRLQEVNTSLGLVKFIQIVGVCQDELQAARDFNVKGVLEIMRERRETGGELLVTDMRRGETIFQLDPENRDKIDTAISTYGSDMTLISALHKYSASKPTWFKEVEQSIRQHDNINNDDSDEHEHDCLLPDIKSFNIQTIPGVERGNLLNMPKDDSHYSKSQDNHYNGSRVPSRMSLESESDLVIEKSELLEVRAYDNLYLLLNWESAKVLPVALEGRLAHRKPFSYQSFSGDLLTTFVPEGAPIECLVSQEQPFARKGTWLQIYVPDELRRQMLKSFKEMTTQDLSTDRNLSWPDHNFHITVVDEISEVMDMS